MPKDDCIFCKIVAGEIPAHKIHEDNNYLAFLDLAKFTEGHTLVIPKEHHQFLWDVPNVGDYFEFVQKVGQNFRNKGFEYVDTMTLGRMVPHVHVHLIPHNGDSKDWRNVMKEVNKMTEDESRRLTDEEGKRIVERYGF